MSLEFYNLVWTGKRLEKSLSDKAHIQCSDKGTPPSPWEVHTCIGDDGRLWCEVFRIPGRKGGFFVVRDFEELLLVAHAETNMAFAQVFSEFAQMVSHPRYAQDIFDNADDEDFDD